MEEMDEVDRKSRETGALGVILLKKKTLPKSGSAQLKCVLFKGQLCIVLVEQWLYVSVNLIFVIKNNSCIYLWGTTSCYHTCIHCERIKPE